MRVFAKYSIIAIFAICISFVGQPAMAQSYDQSAHAKWTSNLIGQGFGVVIDPLGQFCRGMEASGPILEKHPVLKFPLFAIPVGVYKGVTYVVSVPEQYAARVATLGGYGQVGIWETSNWALWAANNPWYTGAKLGALGGGLAVVAIGEGLGSMTFIETAALLTGTGAIGGAVANTGVDWTLKANW